MPQTRGPSLRDQTRTLAARHSARKRSVIRELHDDERIRAMLRAPTLVTSVEEWLERGALCVAARAAVILPAGSGLAA
jgi:hypothetical protein